MTVVPFVFSLTLLFTSATDIHTQVRYGIEALVAAQYIGSKCPTYRTNEETLISIMISSGLTADDLAGQYSHLFKEIDTKAQAHAGMNDQEFCETLFQSYQGEKTEYPLIEKRH